MRRLVADPAVREALSGAGWTVVHEIDDPVDVCIMEGVLSEECPQDDPLTTMAIMQQFLFPPLWAPTVDGVLADSVVREGEYTLLASRNRVLLYEATSKDGIPSPGANFLVLMTGKEVDEFIQDGARRSFREVAVITPDVEGKPCLLVFPMNEAKVLSADLRRNDALSQMPPSGDEGSKDPT